MTTVRVRVHRPSATGNIPAGGSIQFTPTRATTVGGVPTTLVLPAPFTLSITAEEHMLDLTPNGAGWAWRVYEVFPGTTSTTRYLSVPEVFEGTIVDYTALAQVDPGTLEPLQDPQAPLWFVYVDALEAEAAAAKVAALAAQSAATGSQTSAAASASAAGASQTAAAASQTAAAGSATGAATSATQAQTARTGAETARGQAETAQSQAAVSASNASTSATAAAGSATAAATSKTGADAARDTAVAHATGFSAGIVTSLSHLAAPTAAVTGTAPALKLDLGIPRGVPTAITIGEVETGPETPGIVGPQGPTGPQGNPGGIVTGTLLNASDLNTITASGVYRQDNGTNITIAKNYPENSGETGVLIVHQSSGTSFIEQQWHPSDAVRYSRIFWTRSYNYGAWRPWRAHPSNRIDQTAGRAIYQWDSINQREQLIYGDTGERNIAADSLVPVAGWGAFRIRRTGSLVTLCLQGVDFTAATPASSILAAIPTGFVPAVDTRFNFVAESSYASVRIIAGASGVLQMAAKETGVVLYTSGIVTWTTNQQWPTTLPGVSAGSIPNL